MPAIQIETSIGTLTLNEKDQLENLPFLNDVRAMSSARSPGYTPDQRVNSVTLAYLIGSAKAAELLSIPQTAICTWLKIAKDGHPSPLVKGTRVTPNDPCLLALRAENAELRTTITTLKAEKEALEIQVDDLGMRLANIQLVLNAPRPHG